LASFIHASQYYVFGAVEFFIVGYAIEAVSLDAFYAGLIVSAHVATVIIARPILGRISDKKGRRNPIILGSIISSLILLTIPFTVQFSFLLLLSVGYGISFAMVISSTSPLMSELAPAGMTGTYMGFLCTMTDIGQTLGPIVSGIILTIFNQKYIALFASLSFILLASSIIFISRTGKSKTKG
jgi:MFS family permease